MIAFLLVGTLAYELRAGVTPVQKVLGMMRDMKAEGEAEMQKEAGLHAEYIQWCKDTSNTKEDSIREGAALMGKLKASVQKCDSEADKLGDEIAELDGEIAKMQADQKASQELRAKERLDFEAVHKDYSESIDAMGGALNTLGKVAGKISDPALVQSTVSSLPAKAQALLTGFLQSSQPAQASQYAYSSSVGSVIDMITDLQEKLTGERKTLQREEDDAQHAYRMLQQELTMNIESSTDERDAKAERKAERQSKSGADAADLADTTNVHDEDTKYLAELVALCSQKASDFEARQTLRSEELDAVQQAIDIIADQAVSGAADTHLPSLAQLAKTALFLRSAKPPQLAKVAALLQERAVAVKSKTLAAVALQVQAGGHFDKVVQMIKDMITKLTQQAAEEAEHKAWCDGELKQNKQTRDTKTEAIDQLTATSDLLSAEIAKLGEEMADLTAQIAELDSNVQAATEQRQKEKAANTQAVADAKVAQQAVRSALKVLKDFYAKAAKATALVQTQAKSKGPGDDAPASFDTAYRGMGGSSGGVVGMLDVILSDFVRLAEETTAEEESQSREFEKFSSEASADRKVKSDSLEGKTKLQTKKAKDLNQAKEDLARTQAELGSAQDYYAELKTSCIDADVSFQERVQRREEEIASLKEALSALSDE
jgi:hypothetical protein